MDEKNIISQILAGDSSAYRPLVERYQTGLIIHCERLISNRHDAEDIAQESFVKAYDQLASFDDTKARFSTWLYRIATNKAIDYLRKNKRRVDIENINEFADQATPEELLDDEKLQLHQAIDSLEPPVLCAVIKAYFWEGKSYQVIAAENNTTTNTVGTWMRRAKAQLKEKIS